MAEDLTRYMFQKEPRRVYVDNMLTLASYTQINFNLQNMIEKSKDTRLH
jgi:hypothetical protein